MSKIDASIIGNCFEEIMKNVIPEALQDYDKSQGIPPPKFTKQLNDRSKEYSERKAQNRMGNLYENVNMVEHFKLHVNKTVENFNQNQIQINFKNENYKNSMMNLLNC